MSYQALLFCPDDKTAHVVTQVLAELDFTVELCNEPFAAVKKLMAQHFDALVVDCDNEQNAALLFKSARNSGSNQSSLAVAVVEGQAGVAKAFRIGANLVLTKPINVEQSKGTLRVARGLLRKADSAKPTAVAGSELKASSAISESSISPAPSLKPLAAAFTTKSPIATSVPVNDTGFEREVEPGPKAGPTEAAMLESMHDSVFGGGTTTPIVSGKDSPWQPVSKLAEPMASALRAAAEAANTPSSSESADTAPNWTVSRETKDHRPFSSASSGQGSASAPAPARADWKPSPKVPEFQAPKVVERASVASTEIKSEPSSPNAAVVPMEMPKIEPPTFAALAVKDHEETEGSGKKAYVLIAVVVLATIFTGYVAYQKMHAGGMQPTSKPVEVTVPNPSPTGSTASSVPPSATPASTQANSAVSQEIVLTTPASKGDISDVTVRKPSAAIHASTTVPAPSDSQDVTQTIIVKNSPATLSKPVEPDMAPPEAIGAPSDNQALSGIVAISPATVAKPAVMRLKVSQGVSQGLLMKRVQPVYPAQALQMRIEGTVLLEASIGKDGKISGVRVLKGDNILAKAATDAVRQWKYNPYFLNGEPVEIQTQISVTFKLP